MTKTDREPRSSGILNPDDQQIAQELFDHALNNDKEILYGWFSDLVETLADNDISVTYFTYPGANHNLLPSGWSEAVSNTINFYKQEFSQ